MDYNEAFERLWNHANLPERGRKPEDSFIHAAWQTDRTKHPQDFERLYRDVMACLVAVNHHLNGPEPSTRVGSSSQPLDSALSYCISGILSAGWRYHFQWTRRDFFTREFTQSFGGILVRIGIAWDQVLAGDIDDIVKNAEREFAIDQT